MSDNLAGLIVFLLMGGGVIGLIFIGRFLASKRSSKHGTESAKFEEDKFQNVAEELYKEGSEEIHRATAGNGFYAASPYFVEPETKGCESQ